MNEHIELVSFVWYETIDLGCEVPVRMPKYEEYVFWLLLMLFGLDEFVDMSVIRNMCTLPWSDVHASSDESCENDSDCILANDVPLLKHKD